MGEKIKFLKYYSREQLWTIHLPFLLALVRSYFVLLSISNYHETSHFSPIWNNKRRRRRTRRNLNNRGTYVSLTSRQYSVTSKCQLMLMLQLPLHRLSPPVTEYLQLDVLHLQGQNIQKLRKLRFYISSIL